MHNKKIWTRESIAGYRHFVRQRTVQNVESGNRFTCEDFALHLLLAYARRAGMPVKLSNSTGTFEFRGERSQSEFLKIRAQLSRTSGATDLWRSVMKNTIGVGTGREGNIPDLSAVQVGDIIVVNRGHHIQVVGEVTNDIVWITQGNVQYTCNGWLQLWNDVADPENRCYAGRAVARRGYVKRTGKYGTGDDMRQDPYQGSGRCRRWNSEGWSRE